MENNYNNGEENQTPQYTDPNGTVENTAGSAPKVVEEATVGDVSDASAKTASERVAESTTTTASATTSKESTEDLNQNYQYGSGDYSQNQNYNQNYNTQNYGQSYNQGYNTQGQNYGQDYNTQNYNQNYNMNYNQGMDTTPLSMGQWVLTILAAFIPCAGTILYLVWAFSKNGNINRRNYCRAALIIQCVVLLLYLVFVIVFGVALAGSGSMYY